MNQLTLPLTLFSAAFALPAESAAQVVSPRVRRGPLSALASGLSLNPGTRTSTSETTYVKEPGDQSSPPCPWGTRVVTGGEYSLSMMFPTLHALIELDAMSTGNDIIPTVAGVFTLNQQWAATIVSVTNEADGLPGNGWIDARKAGTYSSRLTPGADLATHFVAGSQGINPSLVGTTVISQLSEHMGFGDDEDIDGFDFALGVIPESNAIASRLLFTRDNEFYFSLTPGSVTDLNGVQFAFQKVGSQTVTADAVTIYKIFWNGSQWGFPRVHLDPVDLGLNANVDNVDAIAVASAYPRATAFSTQRVAGRSQLLVYEHDTISPGVYTIVTGQAPLTSVYYLEPTTAVDEGDDIDAICFIDPEIHSFDELAGTPLAAATSAPLGLSATRTDSSWLLFQVTGSIATGDPVIGPTDVDEGVPWVDLYLSFDFQPQFTTPVSATWTKVASALYAGESTEIPLQLPSMPWLSGTPLYFWAVVRDASDLPDSTWVSAIVY